MINQLELSIESYGISKFLFYKVINTDDVHLETIELLQNQQIPGLVPCASTQEKEQTFIRYDLVSDLTLKTYLSDMVTKGRLLKCLSELIETLMEAQRNSLNLDHFVLNEQYMYIDSFSNRLVLLYMPLKHNNFEQITLKQFLKHMLFMAPYNEEDDMAFFIKLQNYLATVEDISFAELKEILAAFSEDQQKADDNFYRPGSDEEIKTTVVDGVSTTEYRTRKIDKKKSPKVEIEEEVQYKRITRTELDENTPYVDNSNLGVTSINITPFVQENIIDSEDIEEEGTTVLGGEPDAGDDEDEATTTLGYQEIPEPYFILPATNEKVVITKREFTIGRDPNKVDYVSKNRVVGRIHAMVLIGDEEYFIQDNKSTNGTYVNDKKLEAYERVKIKHDDQIKLGNEEYIFKLF
ncbi:FHA domain-containing protein [Alkalihalobacterium elongatum]|uniref:FHA domain-containing protein n=1 Tax=Alkalihalobacterium elongatum TaxID=2675466 RepID=UPI001C2009A5|nr:FHA domain-containing protein [Alkalihalobacterium elongatum]